jgi:hypothetical protein
MAFSGLMSRWTSPAAWIASMPARSCAAIFQDLGQGHAVDVFHGDELAALELDEVEDPADVG